MRGAHPRSRGENKASERSGALVKGSSPLTRGKPKRWRGERPWQRLIPAHAGKTRSSACLMCSGGAHPRSRGENAALDKEGAGVEGSSPLTRGKLLGFAFERTSAGLIPAHAGKTGGRRSSATHPGAHPRSRGENKKSKK